MTKAQKLREIISKPGILVLPGVYYCVGAMLVEKTGFGVVFTRDHYHTPFLNHCYTRSRNVRCIKPPNLRVNLRS